MRSKLLTLLLLFSCSFLTAQDRCGFMHVNGFDHDHGKQRLAAFERVLQQQIAKNKLKEEQQRTTGTIYKIPVIIHIIHNGETIGEGTNISTEQAYSQIEVLNEDFRKTNTDLADTRSAFIDLAGDVEIEFVLATEDPDGNTLPEPGIHRHFGGKSSWSTTDIEQALKPSTIFDPLRYMNMWTINFSRTDLLGYAQWPESGAPGTPTDNNRDTDGLVMGYKYFGSKEKADVDQITNAQFNLGRTVTHEIGHWLGLLHIWGDGDCGVDDFVTDTPEQSVSYGSTSTGCPDENAATCGTVDMWENFMDYTNDDCMSLFTEGQVERMRAVIEVDELRNAVVNSDVNTIDNTPTMAFNAPVFYYDISNCGVTFTSQAYVANSSETPSSIRWEFENGQPATATDEVINVVFPSGTHQVRLIMESSLGTDTAIVNLVIAGGALGTLPLINDFSTGVPNNWSNLSGAWEAADVGGSKAMTLRANNYNNDYSGSPKLIQSQVVSTGTASHLRVSFDVAYAPLQNASASNYDSLALLISNGCNNPFKFWQDGGESLSTAAGRSDAFTPTDSDWKRETLLVKIPEGWSQAAISFSNIGYFGNNIYLDNIEIEAATLDLDLNIGTDQLLCDQASFTLSSDISDADQYEWTKVGSTEIIGTDNQLVIDQSGTYQLYVQRGNQEGLETVSLTFAETPVADFSYIADVANIAINFINESTGASSYQWDFGDGELDQVINPTHFYSQYDVYEVKLTATSICGSNTISTTINDIVALEPSNLGEEILIFPNPNHGKFILALSTLSHFQLADIEVVDILGRTIWKAKSSYFTEKSVDINFQSSGIYFLKLQLDDKSLVRRFLVE